MQIIGLQNSTVKDVNLRASSFIGACGFESRCTAFARRLAEGVSTRVAIKFKERADILSRRENEEFFASAGYELPEASGDDSSVVSKALQGALERAAGNHHRPGVAIDISSMTRAWHGGIVRTLRNANSSLPIEAYFTYVPARFSAPPRHTDSYEIVGPVEGFASLSPPDLPIAAVLGLGYERERALGLQQLLDPKRTVLLIPRFRTRHDLFYPSVLKANRDILERTSREWKFEYWLDEPAETYGLLSRLVSQLLPSYRVVLASLGPKLLGILCFILSTQFPQVSVWRASSGIHGHPRQAYPDSTHLVVLSTSWSGGNLNSTNSSLPAPPGF